MTKDSLAEARALAEQIRFSGDVLEATDPGDADLDAALRGHFAQSDVLIGPSLTPDLYAATTLAYERLKIPPGAAPAFVFGSPEIQAVCLSQTGTDCVIRYSSGLVELLDADELGFVAGHELGHFLLGHTGRRPSRQQSALEFRMRSRHEEISADRVGLLACCSLDTAIRALMKTASGLTGRHLRFDVGAFLGQLRHVEKRSGPRWTTHPSILIRCRALLWFSMSDAFNRGVSSRTGAELGALDERIERDLERWSDGPDRELIQSAESDVLLWTAAKRVVADGSFRREEQRLVEALLGTDVAKRLKLFLSELERAEAASTVTLRLDQAAAHLRLLIPQGFERVLMKLDRRVAEALDGTR